MQIEQKVRSNVRQHKARGINQAGVSLVKANSIKEAALYARTGCADLVVVNAMPTVEILTSLIEHLGGALSGRPFDLIRDIRFNPATSQSIAESLAAHPHHTDGTFEEQTPRSFILQYVETDPDGGGVNSFISIRRMLSQMPPDLVNALMTAKVKFARGNAFGDTHATISSIMYLRTNGNFGFRWRDDYKVSPEIIDERGTPIYQAVNWIRVYLKNASSLQYMAHRGDHLICLNDQVTHARSSLSALSPRWLRRVWIA